MFNHKQMRLEYLGYIKEREELNEQKRVINDKVSEIERKMRIIEYTWDKYLKTEKEEM